MRHPSSSCSPAAATTLAPAGLALALARLRRCLLLLLLLLLLSVEEVGVQARCHGAAQRRGHQLAVADAAHVLEQLMRQAAGADEAEPLVVPAGVEQQRLLRCDGGGSTCGNVVAAAASVA